jgi:hypothetical protein
MIISHQYTIKRMLKPMQKKAPQPKKRTIKLPKDLQKYIEVTIFTMLFFAFTYCVSVGTHNYIFLFFSIPLWLVMVNTIWCK